MRQVVKKNIQQEHNIKNKPKKKKSSGKRWHPKYGTSKLEEYFATEFLDKLGIKYITQFEAKDIGRFYDFYLQEHNLIIEVDGDYYHSFGLVYEEMNPMQKRNKRVDELKDKWALMHGIPILRIWEHDIRKNPKFVMDVLRNRLDIQDRQMRINENKKKRH